MEKLYSAKTRLGADCGSDHELLIAKFRLKLKKVGKKTRTFWYDINKIPYNYIVKVANRFKGLYLIDRVHVSGFPASSPITSWQIDGETMETVTNFIFGDSKSTADGDSSHEIKRCLLLGRKAMTNPYSVLKSKDFFHC